LFEIQEKVKTVKVILEECEKIKKYEKAKQK
jgi:hypothetical protein